MEIYKSVEKQTKLKTFSNQSIMMTFIDSANGEEEEEDSDEFESSEDEDESEYDDLSPEAVESIRFFKDAISQLKEQIEKSTHEFDKLASKKVRKNNSSTIEAKKEKIQATIANSKFHQKKLRKLIRLLKNGMVIEFNLIFALKGDIEEYLNTNGDYEFTKDTELYDDIFNQIAAGDEDYSEIHDDQSTQPTLEDSSGTVFDKNGHATKALSTTPTANPAVTTTTTTTNAQSHGGNPSSHLQHGNTKPLSSHHQQQPNSSSTAAASASANTTTSLLSQQSVPPQSSPEMASPAIVRTLRPASTPSKPVGGLKWSAAAAVGIPEPAEKAVPESEKEKSSSVEPESSSNNNNSYNNNNNNNSNNNINNNNNNNNNKNSNNNNSNNTSSATTAANASTTSTVVKEESIPYEPLVLEDLDADKYKSIISNSPLSKTELNLFSDMKLVRVPPGIQDLAVSFASKRNNDEFKILVDSNDFNQYTTPIYKPYLPNIVQPKYYSQFTNFSFKHPMQLSKFQSSWNRVRAFYGFESLVKEIQTLALQDSPESNSLVSEMTFVLFYGFYYGLTPAENLIAEHCLFELGWKPYKAQLDASSTKSNSISRSASPDGLLKDSLQSNQYFYWFKRLKLISPGDQQLQQQQQKQQFPLDTNRTFHTGFEIGDYQVFDLSFWELFVKYGYKFEYSSCQMEPSQKLF